MSSVWGLLGCIQFGHNWAPLISMDPEYDPRRDEKKCFRCGAIRART